MLSRFGSRAAASFRFAPRMLAPPSQTVRRFNIHEYQSMELFRKFNVACMPGDVATTGEEAEQIANGLHGPDYVVKAQVLAGGRGKGKFIPNNFQGGVQMANSPLEASAIAEKMLGQSLVTKQTGEEGKPCNKVVVTERLYLRRETYFAILMDREHGGPVMVGSPKGGMNIEEVAEETPELIFKEAIDINKGLQPEQARRLATSMGFSGEQVDQCVEVITNLYKLFLESDNTLIEINPMAETHDGQVLCLDAKLNFDDNALYRQKDVAAYRDTSQEDQREVAAEDHGLNYIGLDGNIGCLVNGAGLAMATMDVIKLFGGEPANFLDLGGGATEKQVTEAFALLDRDPKVDAILVNIFGGIMRCDVIALGLIQAVTTLGVKKPLVVRLAGTNVDAAKQLIEDSGLRMVTADDLGEAAHTAVQIVEIMSKAKAANLGVEFQLPL